MKTQYQYIHFVKVRDKPKTSVWNCLTRQGDRLGQVKWFGSWRQYCFFPNDELLTVFSAGCLLDIYSFITELSDLVRYHRRVSIELEKMNTPERAETGETK